MAFYLCILLAFVACKKKEEIRPDNINNTQSSGQTQGQSAGLIYCNTNGKNWNSDDPSKIFIFHNQNATVEFDETVQGTAAELFSDTLTLRGVSITGADSSQILMEVVLTKEKIGTYTIGSYPAQSAGTAYAHFYNKIGYNASNTCKMGYNPTGTITITKFTYFNTYVSGTFNITMNPKDPSNPNTPKFDIVKGSFTDVVMKP